MTSLSIRGIYSRNMNQIRRIRKISRELRQRVYPAREQDSGARLATQISAEGLLSAIVINLATVYTAMFANRMGATGSQIGIISSLPQFFALVSLIPGALLAGRLRDRRKPVEFALILAGLFYGLAGFSPLLGNLRVWFLIGMISMANAPLALYNTTWQNYFSDIIPIGQRNSFYTMRTSMTYFAGIVVVQAVGIILGNASSDGRRIWLYQCCYWLAFMFSMLQLFVLRQSPRDVSDHPSSSSWQDLRTAFRELLKNRTFMRFFGISLILHSGWYMAWPTFFIAQVTYMHADESWLGYLTVSAGILQWLSVRPWGKYIDRHGARNALAIGAFGLALNPVVTIFCAYLAAPLQLPVLLILSLFNACTFGAFQISILQCLLEVIPVRYRSLNLSIYTSALLAANAVMPMLAIQIYTAAGTNLAALTISMIAATLVRLIGSVLFIIRWYHLRYEPDCGIRA